MPLLEEEEEEEEEIEMNKKPSCGRKRWKRQGVHQLKNLAQQEQTCQKWTTSPMQKCLRICERQDTYLRWMDYFIEENFSPE